MDFALELILAGLLLATFLQALRLERALTAMKRDRGALEGLIANFKDSTRHAEAGIQKLRAMADGTARRIDAQIAASTELRQELAVLTERGERVADRLEQHFPASVYPRDAARAAARADEASAAERELLATLRRRGNA